MHVPKSSRRSFVKRVGVARIVRRRRNLSVLPLKTFLPRPCFQQRPIQREVLVRRQAFRPRLRHHLCQELFRHLRQSVWKHASTRPRKRNPGNERLTTRLRPRSYGPTVLVSLLAGPITTHTTWPVPSGAHEGEPTPAPPTLAKPNQPEPLKTLA